MSHTFLDERDSAQMDGDTSRTDPFWCQMSRISGKRKFSVTGRDGNDFDKYNTTIYEYK